MSGTFTNFNLKCKHDNFNVSISTLFQEDILHWKYPKNGSSLNSKKILQTFNNQWYFVNFDKYHINK